MVLGGIRRTPNCLLPTSLLTIRIGRVITPLEPIPTIFLQTGRRQVEFKAEKTTRDALPRRPICQRGYMDTEFSTISCQDI